MQIIIQNIKTHAIHYLKEVLKEYPSIYEKCITGQDFDHWVERCKERLINIENDGWIYESGDVIEFIEIACKTYAIDVIDTYGGQQQLFYEINKFRSDQKQVAVQ